MIGREEIDLLVAGRHTNPHHLLGAHANPDGVSIRAWRPGADAVSAHPEGGGEPVALERTHPAGVFEGTLEGVALPLRYELDIHYPDGNRFRLRDPYAIPPTLGDLDLRLIGEGRHHELYQRLGAHPSEVYGIAGTAFAVWAPAARSVSVVGDFNSWDGRLHPMGSMGSTGIWEIFLPDVGDGARYKFEIHGPGGDLCLKADPFAFEAEVPPGTASVVRRSRHRWRDEAWLAARSSREPLAGPVPIYEVHLGSWRQDPEQERPVGYRELAGELAAYAHELGFTHVELMPVMAHPFTGSWGYQVTSYYAPMPQFGSPDDLREFVEILHEAPVTRIARWIVMAHEFYVTIEAGHVRREPRLPGPDPPDPVPILASRATQRNPRVARTIVGHTPQNTGDHRCGHDRRWFYAANPILARAAAHQVLSACAEVLDP